jgi:pilus assembly protein CpaE
MTILCEVDDLTANALVASLGARAHVVTSLTAASIALLSDPDDRVVVIGARVDMEEVRSFAEHLRAEHPDVAIVLLRFDATPEFVTQAHALGVRDVQLAGDVAAVTAAVEQAEQAGAAPLPAAPKAPAEAGEPTGAPPPAGRPRGRLVTVFAAKGGCGKTTLATNLAAVLNDDGAHSVCLVDLDLEFGDVAVSLQITPAKTLIDAVDIGHLDPINVSVLLTSYRPALNCVLAPVEPGDAERIPTELIGQLLDALLHTHEYVVVDTPSQLSEPVLAAMDMTHNFLLLTTPEIPALKNLRLTLDMLDLLGYDPNARSIVFNRADARSGLSAADVENAIKTPITARIPNSYDVPASINRGVPLAISDAKHPVTQAIRELAELAITGSSNTSHRRPSRRGLKLRMRSS